MHIFEISWTARVSIQHMTSLNISKLESMRVLKMLKGWLLYHASDAKKNISYINWFIQEAESMDIKLTLVLFGDLNSLLKKHKPNFIINRTRDAFVAELIESFKIPVFNSRQITKIFNDKYK